MEKDEAVIYKETLLQLIDNIVQYGIYKNLNTSAIKKDLLKIYLFYLSNVHYCDDTETPDFDRNEFKYISENLENNFSRFTDFKIFQDIHNLQDVLDIAFKDPIECLTEIIYDLLETKWRLEKYGVLNGMNFFDFQFKHYTEENILDLLKYLKKE